MFAPQELWVSPGEDLEGREAAGRRGRSKRRGDGPSSEGTSAPGRPACGCPTGQSLEEDGAVQLAPRALEESRPRGQAA